MAYLALGLGPRSSISGRRRSLEANGIVGPETWGAIEQALIMVDVSLADMATLAAPTRLSCSDETWKQFEDLIAIVTGVRSSTDRGATLA